VVRRTPRISSRSSRKCDGLIAIGLARPESVPADLRPAVGVGELPDRKAGLNASI